jgi:hypothetical protein
VERSDTHKLQVCEDDGFRERLDLFQFNRGTIIVVIEICVWFAIFSKYSARTLG